MGRTKSKHKLVLIADDERGIRESVSMILRGEGYDVLEAPDGNQALELAAKHHPDLMLLDVKMPGKTGLAVLAEISKRRSPQVTPAVVVISAVASIASAVKAVKSGAYDFLEKPLSKEKLLITVANAIKNSSIHQENVRLREALGDVTELVGSGESMVELRRTIAIAAGTDSRVLIYGESGTGKELVARMLFANSPRKDNVFVKVNCAAIPAELIESELFGYEKGAFTGADQRKPGRFELAHGGTLFLDEIGDLHPDAQAKLLRVLQEGEIEPVGGVQPLKVDVRVIAATNKRLPEEISRGGFREDLYYRLRVVPINCPALRERPEDIPELIEHFSRGYCRLNQLAEVRYDDSARKALSAYHWPGNVRELKNLVERLVIFKQGGRIGKEDLPVEFLVVPRGKQKRASLSTVKGKVEAEYIAQVLAGADWNVSRAAGMLGIDRTNLHKKIRRYGLKRGK